MCPKTASCRTCVIPHNTHQNDNMRICIYKGMLYIKKKSGRTYTRLFTVVLLEKGELERGVGRLIFSILLFGVPVIHSDLITIYSTNNFSF